MANDLEHYKRYGWVCNEDNLATLPSTAPQAAKDLAKWLTLEGRRSSLQEWINCVADDGRIHGKFWHIGAWTQRMSHSKPNQANIMAAWDDRVVPKTAVEEVKAKYDSKLRECWTATNYLLGTDAEGIQLRILAHYMESPVYRDAIVTGDKAKGTDIHTINQKALGSICRSRDDAKTWIYAWLLGAGKPKQASILGCTLKEAKEAEDKFLTALPELKKLRSTVIKRDAMRGYFVGLDGRKVKCNSEHLMLAGYLQNGEAIIVKRWVLKWVEYAKNAGLDYTLVDIVHDEVQCEVPNKETGDKLLSLQKKAMIEVGTELKLFCPLSAEGSLGFNWRDTH